MSVDNAHRPAMVGDVRDRAHTAREPVRADHTCAACGYGVSARAVLPRCPMCGAADWLAVRPAVVAAWAPPRGR